MGWTTYQGTDSSAIALSFSPGVDVFVGYRIALGASLDITHSSGCGVDAMSHVPVTYENIGFGIGPRVAYDIPIASSLSLYPRGRISFGYRKHDLSSGSNHNTYGEATINVGLYVPLLVHVAAHAFVGLGPFVSYDVLHLDEFGRQNRAVSGGASWIVGGWL